MNDQKQSIVFDRLRIRKKNKSGWSDFWYRDIVEIYVDSDRQCSILKLSDGKEHTFDLPLQVLEDNLPVIFFRCNRSVIVNLGYMNTNQIEDNELTIAMNNGNSYLVSQNRHEIFQAKLSELSIDLSCATCLAYSQDAVASKTNLI